MVGIYGGQGSEIALIIQKTFAPLFKVAPLITVYVVFLTSMHNQKRIFKIVTFGSITE